VFTYETGVDSFLSSAVKIKLGPQQTQYILLELNGQEDVYNTDNRCLLGWGVRTITFVDNAKVQFLLLFLYSRLILHLRSVVSKTPCSIITGCTCLGFHGRSDPLCCYTWLKEPRQVHAGSTKANGREPKTGLGQVLNFKLGCFDDVPVLIYVDIRPHLQLKTRPRFSSVSLSLSMVHPIDIYATVDDSTVNFV